MFTGTSTAGTGPSEGITIEKIIAAGKLLDQHERENSRRFLADMAGGLFNPFGGMRVVESPLAMQTVSAPKRAHKKRRNQTEAYHRRIQKKWTKRFGVSVKQVPCVYQVDGGRYGLGSYLVLPPGMLQQLRAKVVAR